MYTATIKSIAARKVRLLTTGLAVLLGVAFLAGTLVLTDTIGRTFDTLFADVNAGTDAYVRAESPFSDQRPRLDAALVDKVRKVDGVTTASAKIQGYAQLVGKDGDAIGDSLAAGPTFGTNWIGVDRLNPFELAEGRAPAAPDEVVIDRGTAKTGSLAVGDTTRVLTNKGSTPVTIVGIATFGSSDSAAGASYVMFSDAAAQNLLGEPNKVDAVAVAADAGVSEASLQRRIAATIPDGVEVLTGAEVTEEGQSAVQDQLQFFNVFLVAFAVIALVVGAFIIYNTFSILVAQRTRELALYRALGASRRQIGASVLLEAAVVGAVAAAAGVAAGIGVAAGLRAILEAAGVDLPSTAMVLEPRTIVVSAAVGIGVSVASALFPARRAATVAPIAALSATVAGSTTSRKRIIAGVAVLGFGVLVMVNALVGDGESNLGLGAVLVLSAVLLLGPVTAGPISRLLGAPLPVLRGLPGALARQNAARNPRRTATTAAALMIGVALIGLNIILAASAKESVDRTIDEVFAGDLVVDTGMMSTHGFSPDLVDRIAALPEVDTAVGVRSALVQVNGKTTRMIATNTEALDPVLQVGVSEGSLHGLDAHGIAVLDTEAERLGLTVGAPVDVRFAETGVQAMRVRAIFTQNQLGGKYLAGTAAYDANVADRFDEKIFMAKADGVTLKAARDAVAAAVAEYPQANLQDRTAMKEQMAAHLDEMLGLVYALLALALVIALLGIGNTLALSIFERTRELGLLRAVGMTRRQLRATVRWEAVIVALLGGVLGLAVGVVFGWAVASALESQGITVVRIPAGQLATVTLVAAAAGVVAAILPARRAARMEMLQAISAT
jgi:putative ABC transport system permease protein